MIILCIYQNSILVFNIYSIHNSYQNFIFGFTVILSYSFKKELRKEDGVLSKKDGVNA